MTSLPDRYRLGALLGVGAMGRVYAARDVLLGADVAVKVVRSDLADTARFRERFEAEIRIAALTVHPHLVPLHDTGVTADGTPWVAMARADSGSLADFRGAWPEALRLALDVLEALGALHARGVLHRDLKPANVLVNRGRAWVADLGVAELLDRLGQGGHRIAGSPAYMAPEQRAGQTWRMGPWTDLFALGRTLDEITAGKLVPTGLDDVLAALLDPEPLARFDLAADVRAALLGLEAPAVVRHQGEARRAASVGTWASWTAVGGTRDDLVAAPAEAGSAAPVRPPPSPLPPQPPEEPGRGAQARASLSLVALRELPLVGRDAERQALWDEARAVRDSGKPRAVMIVGEAGAGKTRLARSIVRALEEGGWCETIAVRHDDPPSDGDGLRGAARRALRAWGGEPEPEMLEHLARWQARAGTECDPAATLAWLRDGSADQGRRWLLDTLAARAWRGSGALWLDDAARAPAGGGLDLAADLLDGALPVLVIASVRREELEQPAVARAVAALEARGARRLDVARLDLDATEALLGEALTLEPDVAHLVAHRCQGNPWTARLLLLDWADRGVLVDAGGLRYRLAAGVDIERETPEGVESLLARRIDDLAARAADPDDALRRLHRLALAGARVPREVALRLDPPASAAELFRDDGGFRWTNALVFDVVLRRAEVRTDAQALHGEIAAAWEAWGAHAAIDVAAMSGQHRMLAGDVREATIALRRAIPGGSSTLWSGSRALRRATLAAADASGDRAARGMARLWIARVEVNRDLTEASLRAAEALEHLSGDPFAEAHALHVIASVHRARGEHAAAERHAGRALEAARRLGDPEVTAAVLTTVARLHVHGSRFGEAGGAFAEALALARVAGHAHLEADALFGLGSVARMLRDPDRARPLLAEARDRFAAGSNPTGVSNATRLLASLELDEGHLDAAEALIAADIAALRAAGNVVPLQKARLDLATVLRHRGDLDGARRTTLDVLRWTEAAGRSSELPRASLALLEVDAGDYAAADAHLDALGDAPGWLVPYVLVCRAASAAGRGDEAALDGALTALAATSPDPDMRRALAVAAREAARRGWDELAARCRR